MSSTLVQRVKAAWGVVTGSAQAIYPNVTRFLKGATGGAKWPYGLSSSGRPTVLNHTEARRNARNAMLDSVQARAVVNRKAHTIADGGLRLELSPVIGVLGITREYAAQWAADVAERFDLWAKSKKAHRAEQMNWYQSHQLWAEFSERDNDQFVRLFYENDPDLLNPLQFDFLDPDMIRGDALTSNYGFQGGEDGIIRDSRGRETAYKVFVKQPDLSYEEVELPAKYPGGRRAMLHGYKGEYAGQGRGYSPLAHAVQEFEKITDYSQSVIQRAINQAIIWAFTEPGKDEDAENPLADMINNTAGPAAQYLGQDPQPVEGLPALPPEVVPGLESFNAVPNVDVQTPGGLYVGNLRKGSKITFPSLSAPGDTFDKFVDAFTGYLSAASNVPLEVVLMKFGQNYSASRATLLLFFRVVCIERENMATHYLNPVVEMWLSGEIAAGRVAAPGWADPRLRAAWLNCTWIGSGPPDIDPQKSAKARQTAIEIGLTNIEREATDHNGTSAATNIAINNAVYGAYKAMPWNESGNPPPGSAAPAPAKAAAAALIEEIRMIVREEIDNA